MSEVVSTKNAKLQYNKNKLGGILNDNAAANNVNDVRNGFDDDEEEIKQADGRTTNGGYVLKEDMDDSDIFGTSHINNPDDNQDIIKKYNQDDSFIPDNDKSQVFNQVVKLDKHLLKNISQDEKTHEFKSKKQKQSNKQIMEIVADSDDL